MGERTGAFKGKHFPCEHVDTPYHILQACDHVVTPYHILQACDHVDTPYHILQACDHVDTPYHILQACDQDVSTWSHASNSFQTFSMHLFQTNTRI
jgi:hypothetical protein